MIPGRTYTPVEWLVFVWRRRWTVITTFLLVTTVAVVIAASRPYRYRAEALVLAEPRSVAAEYVRASVTSESIARRLPSISQQILSYARLEQIIQDLNLYAALRETRPMDAAVRQMRSDTEVRTTEGAESFRVSYTSEDPDLAVLVTERLVLPFIEEHSRNRAELAHETSAFLESQLEEARGRLVDQEKRLEAYRLRYGPELPSQRQSNMQALQNLQTQLQAVNESISRIGDRRLLLARQLADFQSEQFFPDSAVAGQQRAPEAGSTSTAQSVPATVQYEAAVKELRALELRLTAQHPDVVNARRRVADLERQVEREKGDLADSAVHRPPTAAETLKQNKINELQAELESLDRQAAERQATEEQLRADIETYQRRVATVPIRESELASLTRDYETLQNTYRTLLAKREDSKISENLEQEPVGGQFRIIDPPHRPQTPLGSSRRLIAFEGAVAGAMIGVALALLLQWLDTTLATASDVDVALGLPVVATIPLMFSDRERRRARQRRVGWSVAFATLVVAVVMAAWLGSRP